MQKFLFLPNKIHYTPTPLGFAQYMCRFHKTVFFYIFKDF